MRLGQRQTGRGQTTVYNTRRVAQARNNTHHPYISLLVLTLEIFLLRKDGGGLRLLSKDSLVI